MKKTRQEQIESINEAVRDNGNTNVLIVHAIAQHLGLSASEFECCSLIQEKGPFTAGELARRCHITTGGMTGLIDRLERRSFVRREADPNDRRRVLITAVRNKDAEQKVRALYQPMQDSFDKILASYTDEEIDFVADFLLRINKMFSDSLESLPDKQADGKF